MSVKVFQVNEKGKIEFTRSELEKLLNDTYKEGHRDGENKAKMNYWTWTAPYVSSTTISPLCNGLTYDTGTLRTSDSITGSVTGATSAATVSTVNLADKVTACDAATETPKQAINTISVEAVKAPENAVKVSLSETPSRTYEAKGITYNVDDLVKTVDALLSGKSIFDTGLYTPNTNGTKKATENNSVASLAKELRYL